MKNHQFIILLCVSSLFLNSCKNQIKEIDYVVFTGNIQNTKESFIEVTGEVNDFKREISITENGSFSDTLKITSPGLYQFKILKKLLQYISTTEIMYICR